MAARPTASSPLAPAILSLNNLRLRLLKEYTHKYVLAYNCVFLEVWTIFSWPEPSHNGDRVELGDVGGRMELR